MRMRDELASFECTPLDRLGRDLLFLLRDPASGSFTPNARNDRRFYLFFGAPASASSADWFCVCDAGAREPAPIPLSAAGPLTRRYSVFAMDRARTHRRPGDPIRSSRPCWARRRSSGPRVFPSATLRVLDLSRMEPTYIGHGREPGYLAGVLSTCRGRQDGTRSDPRPGPGSFICLERTIQ